MHTLICDIIVYERAISIDSRLHKLTHVNCIYMHTLICDIIVLAMSFCTSQCVVTASGDTTLKLWAVSDRSCLKTFEGHTMSVLKAIFITRGTQIASRSVHNSVGV